MAFEKLTENIKGVSEDAQQFAESTIAYHKLDAFKKGMQAAISIARVTIFGVLMGTVFLFLSIALAIYLGDVLESPALGYVAVSGIYVVVFILSLFILPKPLERFIITYFSTKYFRDNVE